MCTHFRRRRYDLACERMVCWLGWPARSSRSWGGLTGPFSYMPVCVLICCRYIPSKHFLFWPCHPIFPLDPTWLVSSLLILLLMMMVWAILYTSSSIISWAQSFISLMWINSTFTCRNQSVKKRIHLKEIYHQCSTVIPRFTRLPWQPKNRVNQISRYTSHSVGKMIVQKMSKKFL